MACSLRPRLVFLLVLPLLMDANDAAGGDANDAMPGEDDAAVAADDDDDGLEWRMNHRTACAWTAR